MAKTVFDDAMQGQILYVVVLPPENAGDFLPFQGFSTNVLPVLPAIHHICTLPTAIGEFFRSRAEALKWRAAGLAPFSIVLLDVEFIDDFPLAASLVCFVSGAGTRDRVEERLSRENRRGLLHLTTDENVAGVEYLYTFSRQKMFSWATAVAETIVSEDPDTFATKATSKRNALVQWPPQSSSFRSVQHNVTLPIETALRSLGISIRPPLSPKDVIVGGRDEDYASAIRTAADELLKLRHDSNADLRMFRGTPVLIVAVPSVYRHLSGKNLSKSASGPVRKAVANVLRQKQYTALKGEETAEIVHDPISAGILQARAGELRAMTAALGVSASSLCAPVLRCPPQIDRIRELLIRLAGMIRSRSPKPQRVSKLARQIGLALRDAMPGQLLELIEEHKTEGIKLIGDTPLELLTINDLPLGLRATTSRLPTLPGNLLMRQGLLRLPALIDPADLLNVLVIRAFERHDPLREMFVRSLKEFDKETPLRTKIKVVDVETRDDFIAALNDYDGLLAIFDGHGAHARTDPQGTLSVGPMKFNPFELYGKVRVPPIVILSACETHTLEGFESSVASAFLFMGSSSVLGTLAPIDGRGAAILLARFLFRFSHFLTALQMPLAWSEVVTGMLRMSYVTDVLRHLQIKFRISPDDYREIHTAANISINELRPDWFERFLNSISEKTKLSAEITRNAWLEECYFTETMRYVHLGQPEHMFVVPPVPAPLDSGESRSKSGANPA